MGFFSRSKKDSDIGHVRKLSTYDVHDPILTAIRDEEPFQQSAYSHSQAHVGISPEMRVRDIFGNVITNPDRSNPTRPTNERPLDTIRTFEYACTGDERLRDDMETPRLGWTTRSNFTSMMPQFDTNPYAPSSPPTASNYNTFGQNPYGNTRGYGGNGDNNQNMGINSSNNTFQSPPAPPAPKKKKRGLFGRKK
jgi:hypothetical protein